MELNPLKKWFPYGHGALNLRDFAETDFSMVPTSGDLLKRIKLFNISGR
jgi:hypothetical protein